MAPFFVGAFGPSGLAGQGMRLQSEHYPTEAVDT